MSEFIPEDQPMPEPAPEQPPMGLPHLDTSGTTAPSDPYGMVAPGAVPPEDDHPPEIIQAAQEDLVGRVMAFISDDRKQQKMEVSPANAVLNRLNLKGTSAPESIGATAAEIIMMITDTAKRQEFEYPTLAVLGGGAETVQLLMDVARDSGIFPDIPESEDDPAYLDLAEKATLEAAKTYGERMMATGRIDQQEYAEILNSLMEEEAALGELDDWDPSEMMNADAFRNLMNRGVGLAQQKSGSQEQGPPPQAPQGV